MGAAGTPTFSRPGGGTGGSPSGPAGGDLTGSYPNPTLVATGVVPDTYGDSTHVPRLTVDAKGRVTLVTNVAISGSGGSGVDISDEGIAQGTATTLDFVGAGVTASVAVGVATITISGGGGGGADCTTAPTLLCLAGRTGTTNDPTISSDGPGSLYGSAAIGAASALAGLRFNSKQEATLGPFSVNSINANTTSLVGTSVLLEFGNFNGTMIFNDDASFGNSGIIGFGIGGDWQVGDDSLGGPGLQVFGVNATIHNPTGVGKHLLGSLNTFGAFPTLIADDAACDIPTGGIQFNSKPTFRTIGSGILAVGDWFHYDAYVTVDGAVTLGKNVGYSYDGVKGTGGTVVEDVGVAVTDGDIIGSSKHWSFLSAGPIREMHHAGPAVFGVGGAVTTVSVGLELNSTDHAFLLSRMDTAARDALTAADGMFLYDTDLPNGLPFQGRSNGTWVSFVTDDGAGNVTVPGKLTVIGAIDPTDITYTGRLIAAPNVANHPVVIANMTNGPDPVADIDAFAFNNNALPIYVAADQQSAGLAPSGVTHEHHGGTYAAPTATGAGSVLGQDFWTGHDGSAEVEAVKLLVTAGADFTGSDRVAHTNWLTAAGGAFALVAGTTHFTSPNDFTQGPETIALFAGPGSTAAGSAVPDLLVSAGAVAVNGDLHVTGQLISTVAIGTPPIVTTSTDRVVNLNADTVDGLHATDLAQKLTPIRLTGRNTDISDTTITGTAGLYRVEVYIRDEAADLTAGTVTVHIKFSDGQARDSTIGPIVLTSIVTGVASGTIFANLASGNLTYGTTHTGIFGTATYALDVTTEKLS